MKNIRNNAKALIIENGKLLVIEKLERNGDLYYGLPGGGQEPGELFPDTLYRECLEEIGAKISVISLAFISEAFINNMHHVYHVFYAALLTRPNPTLATETDDSQIGLAWLDTASLSDKNIYPKFLRRAFDVDGNYMAPLYINDNL